jgi:hypothetical protein
MRGARQAYKKSVRADYIPWFGVSIERVKYVKDVQKILASCEILFVCS